MPLSTKHRFLISPQLGESIYLNLDRHRPAAAPISGAATSHAALAACLTQGCRVTQAAAMTATGSERSRKIERMDNPKHEPRNEARRRALKGARIVFKGHGATIDCTVRNLSDRGACLNVESYVGIPRYT